MPVRRGEAISGARCPLTQTAPLARSRRTGNEAPKIASCLAMTGELKVRGLQAMSWLVATGAGESPPPCMEATTVSSAQPAAVVMSAVSPATGPPAILGVASLGPVCAAHWCGSSTQVVSPPGRRSLIRRQDEMQRLPVQDVSRGPKAYQPPPTKDGASVHRDTQCSARVWAMGAVQT
jgi:hypothetical protein